MSDKLTKLTEPEDILARDKWSEREQVETFESPPLSLSLSLPSTITICGSVHGLVMALQIYQQNAQCERASSVQGKIKLGFLFSW